MTRGLSRRVRTRGRPLRLALAIAFTACAGERTGPIDLPQLRPGTRYAHMVGDAALPAITARRVSDGQVEATVLDSAALEVSDDGGYWIRAWTSVYRTSAARASSEWREAGRWAREGNAYAFRSASSELRAMLRDPGAAMWEFSIPVAGSGGPLPIRMLESRPAPGTVGTWRALSVRDVPVPATMYVFTGPVEGGREISAHFVLDSATLWLDPVGGYVHRVWYTEWEGEVGGPPHSIRLRYSHADFGTWTTDGDALRTTSAWFQNHRMTGSIAAPGQTLLLPHGLTPGDELVTVRYGR
jgi:hypothetical protein